jgi:Na+/H+ antiporter NhaD/arsenite permease-like protein
MTTGMSRWVGPLVAIGLGFLSAAASYARHASPVEAAVAFAAVAGYAILVLVFRSRFDVASLLSGLPRDERWESINLRALALAALVLAVAIYGAFLATSFGGGDPLPYAWLGACFAAAYLGGIAWYRVRS